VSAAGIFCFLGKNLMTLAALVKLARWVPKNGRLVYCLFRDSRTPPTWKAGLGVATFLIVTPFVNVPEVIPVLGEMETIALLFLAARIAIARAPKDLVEEHEAAIESGTSLFHTDLQRARARAEDLRSRRPGLR
jgi:uncharacterized membrane protein YkvA (DUF1232 family)